MGLAPDLDSTLQRLETFGVRLGLETTRRLLKALGEPQKSLRPVLVAGTNGKGSTAALLASMVTMAGYKTGLYTSPHLESVEERIRIDGRSIATHRLAETVAKVVEVAEKALGYLPTYFEALTSAAFRIFAEESVDLAVLEVGLGGRLDATNGVEPELSLITEIGLEHQEYLGESLSSIAREKAGILRSGRRAIAWVQRSEARHAIQEVADELQADLVWGPELVTIEQTNDLGWSGQQIEMRTPGAGYEVNLPLVGTHQKGNLALAILAAEALVDLGLDRLTTAAIAQGAASTRWPGRLEWIALPRAKPVLLDVAHNPDGAETLKRSLEQRGGRYVLLFGALADKQVREVLPVLADGAAAVILTRPESERALAPESLAPLVPGDSVLIEDDRTAALTTALEVPADFLVVSGSIYLVGNVRVMLRERFGVPLPATEPIIAG